MTGRAISLASVAVLVLLVAPEAATAAAAGAATETAAAPAAAAAAAPETAAAAETAPAAGTPPPRLTLHLPSALATTGGLLLATGLATGYQAELTPPACRWCEPGRLDVWARDALRWRHPGSAARASDALVVAVPAGAALTLGLLALREEAGDRALAEDLVVVGEAVAVAAALTTGAKLGAARLRPGAWASGAPPSLNDRHSFWSGHTATAFAAAAAATQVARLRGRAGWRWLGAISLAGAAAVGWLRVAGDQHWLTDVVTGAAVGTAAGLGVPLLVLRPAGHRAPPVTLAPAPGGLALVF